MDGIYTKTSHKKSSPIDIEWGSQRYICIQKRAHQNSGMPSSAVASSLFCHHQNIWNLRGEKIIIGLLHLFLHCMVFFLDISFPNCTFFHFLPTNSPFCTGIICIIVSSSSLCNTHNIANIHIDSVLQSFISLKNMFMYSETFCIE